MLLKTELHSHTDQDPEDRIPHTTPQLIDRAAELGYQVLAVTLHDRYFDPAPFAAYARERGVLLLSGIERSIGRSHVLLINFGPDCASVRTFEEIARLKTRRAGLVIAPHAFYPIPSALGPRLESNVCLFDAIELNSMYTRQVDFNRRAVALAKAHHKPLVGNTDLHRLDQLGTTYSLVDAEPQADAICEAIRTGRVEVRTQPIGWGRVGFTIARMVIGGEVARAGWWVRGRSRRA